MEEEETTEFDQIDFNDDCGHNIETRLIPVNASQRPSTQHRFLYETAFISLPESVQAILIAGNMLVLIVAFCGNIAALTIVAKAKISKRTTKCFLITLAVSDVVLVLSSVPIELGKLTNKRHLWVFGKFICNTISSVQIHSVLTNCICLFGISFERYLSVIRSPKLSSLSAGWETKIPCVVLVLSWIVPFGGSIPMLFAFDIWTVWIIMGPINGTFYRVNEDTYYMCQGNLKFPFRAQMYAVVLFVYALLLVGFVLCYGSIIRFVKSRAANFAKSNSEAVSTSTSSANNGHNITEAITTTQNEVSSSITTTNKSTSSGIGSSTASNGPSLRNQHQRTVRLIMSLILVFIICKTPVMIFNLVTNIFSIRQTVVINSTFTSLHLLSNIGTVVNPFLYAIWNNSLRSTKTSTTDRTRNKGCCGAFNCCKYICCCVFKDEMNRKSRNATSSVANAFKFRRNSLSFSSHSKIFPSSGTSVIPKTRNEFVRGTAVSTTIS